MYPYVSDYIADILRKSADVFAFLYLCPQKLLHFNLAAFI